MTGAKIVLTLTQKQIAAAIVQDLGRLGKIPNGWLTETDFKKDAKTGAISATVTCGPVPEEEEKEAKSE